MLPQSCEIIIIAVEPCHQSAYVYFCWFLNRRGLLSFPPRFHVTIHPLTEGKGHHPIQHRLTFASFPWGGGVALHCHCLGCLPPSAPNPRLLFLVALPGAEATPSVFAELGGIVPGLEKCAPPRLEIWQSKPCSNRRSPHPTKEVSIARHPPAKSNFS